MSHDDTAPGPSRLVPTKHILTPAHLAAFKRSDTHREVTQFIHELNDAIVGLKISDVQPTSRSEPLIRILDQILQTARETPAEQTQSRFGNAAFRSFYDKVDEASTSLLEGLVPVDAIPEVRVYFVESWGNKQRIDYGSGMEYNFLCWLLCLVKLRVLQKEDYAFLVLGVFWKYIQVMRYLQSTYWLEPAGSHGVWGLDDYQFLPFLWGAGQLKGHKHLRPKCIHDPEVLEAFSTEYMYLSCISFINSIKTASLRWHSPMLDDISIVKTWDKVNSGMMKMYEAEVLGKLPVMQHAYFGSILPFPSPDEDLELKKALEEEGSLVPDAHGHMHAKSETGWTMDCCGIPVPSAFAEATSRSGIKPIPFD